MTDKKDIEGAGFPGLGIRSDGACQTAVGVPSDLTCSRQLLCHCK